MQFSTRPAIAALLLATGALAKPCGKAYHVKQHPTTLSIPDMSATFSILPFPEPSSTVIQPTSTLITSTVIATPSTASSASAVATTVSSSSSSVVVVTPSTASTSSVAAAATTAASSSSSLTTDQQSALDIQNSVRSDVSETALVWDETLASDALAWAQNLAAAGGSAGTLTHATGTGEGENLYWQSTSDNPYANAATAWVEEKSTYNGEAITGTGNFEEYGHYSMCQYLLIIVCWSI